MWKKGVWLEYVTKKSCRSSSLGILDHALHASKYPPHGGEHFGVVWRQSKFDLKFLRRVINRL
jgi:hypothetical protein